MRIKDVLIASCITVSFSSCVALLGSSKSVYISSSPSNAHVYRDDGKYVGTTPVVYKGKAHHNFILKKDGYYNYELETTRSYNWLWLANILNCGYGYFIEMNNEYKFKDTNYSVILTMKPKPKQTYTPSYTQKPVRIPTLLESVSNNLESYTCSNAYSKITPTFSSSAKRTVMKGSDVFKKYNGAVFMLYGTTPKGNQIWQESGFIINSEGLAVSNYHNFEDARDIVVKLYGSESLYKVSKEDILAFNKNEDYIIFKVRGLHNYPYIPIANKRSEIGDKVYTISSPRGLENTFSSGEISQYRTELGYIQISAPIDHGSSGGVLINEYGEAIGITSAGKDDSGANLNFCKDLLSIMNRFK